jgi:predicted DNA-binding transcriptional regulator AlpA
MGSPTLPATAAPEYVTTEEFAQLVRTSPATIRYWRHINKGPQAFRLGRRALYDRAEVLAWVEAEKTRQAVA